MPDNTSIEKTIYKLELDDSGYLKGIESLAQSTAKFTQAQEAANKTLQTNETALKANADRLAKAKKDLEDYTGTNARYRKQLEGDIKSAERDQAQLTELVNKNRLAYESATKAANDFANATAKAKTLQEPTGKIPVPSLIPQPGANVQALLSKISLGDLPKSLEQTIPEFEELRKVIADAELELSQFNEESDEFKQLKPIVDEAKGALQLYDDATKKAGESTVSLRTQIRQGRDELVRMAEAGKENTKEYAELELRVAKLTDAYADQQQRIRTLASDTRLLDFGKASITAATSAFQAYTSVAILVGDENEELQKKTMQLFAAMQLLTSIEQVSNLVRREGIIGTNLQAAAQATYTAVVGASTGALKAFRLALLGTGIGAVIVGIGFLVYKLQQLKEEQEEAGERQKILTEINTKAAESYAGEVVRLEQIRTKLENLSTPQKERIRLAKEYNKSAEEGNKIDLKQIENIDLVNAAIDRQIAKIKERALAKAAENVLTEKATEFFKKQEELRIKFPALDVSDEFLENVFEQYKAGTLKLEQFTRQQRDQFVAAIVRGDIQTYLRLRSEFNTLSKRVAGITTVEGLTTGGGGGGDKQTENVFEQERQKQRERLAELNRQAVEDERTIRAQFEQQLITEKKRIDDLLKDKKLTKPQAETLKIEAAKINTVELDKSLEDFRKKIADARKKLNDEIRDLQQKSIEDSLNLIRDEFERRKQLIDFNEAKEIEDAKKNVQERLDALETDRLLLGEENYQRARADIVSNGELQIANIERAAAQERIDLSADTFRRSLEQILDEQLTQLDEATAAKILEQKNLLASGAINYEQFQKALTKIQKDEKAQRDKVRLQELQQELDAINSRLEIVTDAAEKEELEAKQRELRRQVATINSETPPPPEGKKQTDTITDYANSIGQLTDAVIGFWQKANEEEAKALDRSISLQEKRVEAAQRIADRGNAEYLKQEEDRLNELNVQRENAARKQLGIDAALQASQLLVGITGAIAKISTGIGAAEAIAEIAIIVGALATGYGLVKSLQGNQPRLAEGTTYVRRGKNPAGRDTIPAWLDEGEAVISADKNKDYHPTIQAIHDRKISPKLINDFVRGHAQKVISQPIQPNYEKFKQVAETKTTHDSKVAGLLNEQNKLLRENNDLNRLILRKQVRVENNIDRNGIATAVSEYLEEKELDKYR